MPLQQRVGFEQEHDLTKPGPSAVRHGRQFAGEDEYGEFLPPRNAWCARLLPLQNAELMPEEQDLNILVMVRSSHQRDTIEQH